MSETKLIYQEKTTKMTTKQKDSKLKFKNKQPPTYSPRSTN